MAVKTLKIEKIHKDAVLPRYAHPGDAGMDLCSVEARRIRPGEAALVRCGIKLELPKGTEAQVRPRSGLALKHRIGVLNSPGTIDEGYRGELGVVLMNFGRKVFRVEKGMRIAQLVVAPVLRVRRRQVKRLSPSRRAADGFGSTGLKG